MNLNEVTSGNAGTYAKMFSALQAGNAPDLGQVEYATLPNFEHVGGVVDLSKYGASSVQPDFVPWTWAQVSQGGAVYAIPQDTGPMGLFYRADLFKKYGLTVPTTWAQYLSDAKKLHAAHPNAYIAAFPANDAQWFAGLAWQAGAKWFSTSGDTWVAGIDDSASAQVANYWQQLISDHLVKVEPDFATEWYKDLSDGTLLTWPTAVWGENTLITNAAPTKGDWRVAAMPNWGATPEQRELGRLDHGGVQRQQAPGPGRRVRRVAEHQPAEHHRPDHQGRPLPGRPGRREAARRQLPGRLLRRPEHLAGLPGRRQAGQHQLPVGPDHEHDLHPDGRTASASRPSGSGTLAQVLASTQSQTHQRR